jgi:hypothetical protein
MLNAVAPLHLGKTEKFRMKLCLLFKLSLKACSHVGYDMHSLVPSLSLFLPIQNRLSSLNIDNNTSQNKREGEGHSLTIIGGGGGVIDLIYNWSNGYNRPPWTKLIKGQCYKYYKAVSTTMTK